MSDSKKSRMVSFWSERARRYGFDPRANTNDVWLREIEIGYVADAIRESGHRRIMDFGCANGYSTGRLAHLNPASTFVGIDINAEMIAVANGQVEQHPNLEFRETDILQDDIPEKFDFIFAIRAFQNLESLDMQKRIFDRLCDLLEADGSLLFIESYLEGYVRLNEDRVKMDLAPLPIHDHLTLLTGEFDRYVSRRMKLVKKNFLSSSYYLTTRLLYSYIAKMSNEPIDYNHPIHQVAAMIPQIGEYGPQRALMFRKN
jgi:SAM-dependent methyltransferase